MKGSHWLIGCGIGCGVIVLLLVALIAGGGLFVRDTMSGFNEALETRELLDERFGEPGRFVPWPAGDIPAERLEVFLAVREASQPQRERIERLFGALPLTEAEARELESKSFAEKVRAVFGIGRSALGLAGELGSFFEARNRSLVSKHMGMGEYTYLYALVYWAWMGHGASESPEDRGSRDDRMHVDGLDMTSTRIRRDLLDMLHNQLESLPGADSQQARTWRDALAAEVDAMERDPDRVPWQEKVPERIASSLEPYRDRLAASYSSACNPFELARNRRSGRFSIRAE